MRAYVSKWFKPQAGKLAYARSYAGLLVLTTQNLLTQISMKSYIWLCM